MSSSNSVWYVVRTRRYKEQLTKQMVSAFADDVYLPLLKLRKPCLGTIMEVTEPLFPCYVFCRFVLERVYYRLTHTPGVADVVCVGGDACDVKESIIEEIKRRETGGVIVIKPKALRPQQRVIVREGVLSGIEAVFERYLSGAERAAILLDSIGTGNIRAVVKASDVALAEGA